MTPGESGKYRAGSGRYLIRHPARSGHDDNRGGVAEHRGRARVEVAAASDGVRVAIRDSRKGTVLAFVVVPADELMTVLSEQPEGPQVIQGDAAGVVRALAIEVRRNEVWLAVSGMDAAVGLDDLMDPLAAVPS